MSGDVSLYLDAKNNLYWLFPYSPTEKGLYIMGFPVKKVDITADCRSLMLEILDLMQYCKEEVNYEKARQELKTRFKRETGWTSVLALQKASTAVIGVAIVESKSIYYFSIYSTDIREKGMQVHSLSCPLTASIDVLAETLKEAFEFYKK